jgi:phage terminase large subunit-like protein
MPDGLGYGTLARWRANPIAFIEQVIHDENGEPFVLLPAERAFLAQMFATDADGRLLYPDLIYACPKKSGKTTLGAVICITMVLLFGGRHAEAYCVANDLEQATSRVFEMCRRIVEASPLLRREARVLADRIEFPATGAIITALATDYASAAGGHPTIAVFDELWGYTSERSRRLWDELVPVPTRRISCRLVVSHAGFEGESALLHEMYRRGLTQPQIGTDLYAGDGLLMFWSTTPIAPWQDERWLAQMKRSLRANQYLRMIENRWVTSESTFVDMAWWDQCVDPDARPLFADRSLAVWVAVDASTKRDSTAIVAVTWDTKVNKVRLVTHKVFQPSASDPLDFEATVEATVRDLGARFAVQQVAFDPFQMAAVSQRLSATGVPMVEVPQSPANLTRFGSNLYELVKGANLVVYPDAGLRLAISRTVAKETSRGYQLTKEKASHKIDVVVALAMAALAAVEGGQSVSIWERASAETLDRVLADVDRYRYTPSEFSERQRVHYPLD